MQESETWTTLKVLNWTKEFLSSKGVQNARLETEWMLSAATGLDRLGIYLQFDRPLDQKELAAFRTMVSRRARREPLQHILGTEEFCGLEIEVTGDVLIPRLDTETLVREALLRIPDSGKILDIGTGSGCIALAIATKRPDATVTATDKSEAALIVARRNAQRLSTKIEFLSGSFFEPLSGRKYDLVLSNPPYIPTEEISGLEPEVRDYDPKSALDGGLDGLDIFRVLIPSASDHIKPGGWLLLEVGKGQSAEVSRLFESVGCYGEILYALDSAGIVRVVGAKREDII